MKIVELLVLLCTIISLVCARPEFAAKSHLFAGDSVPDSDGFFRHDSLLLKRSEKSSTSPYDNTRLKYEAKLAGSIVRLDSDVNVDSISCNVDSLVVDFAGLYNPTWARGDTLVGGVEWGCKIQLFGKSTFDDGFGDYSQKSLPISFMVASVNVSATQAVIRGKHVPFEELFEKLDLTIDDLVPTSDSPMNVETPIIPSPTTPSLVTLIHNITEKHSEYYNKRSVSTRADDHHVFAPKRFDIFLSGERITVQWDKLAHTGDYTEAAIYRHVSASADPVLFSRRTVPNTGSYTFPNPIPVGTLADSNYYAEVRDCGWYCSAEESPYFSINKSPDVVFKAPMRSSNYYSGDSVPVEFTVNAYVGTGNMRVTIWQQRDFVWDEQVTADYIITARTQFSQSFTVQNSWKSDNAYYVYLEWNCAYDWYFCDSQASELFSVVQVKPDTSLSFINPASGKYYFASRGDLVDISWAANFDVNTPVKVEIYKRRVGWDKYIGEFTRTHPANQKRIDFNLIMETNWEPSTTYYMTAKWGCSGDYCAGVAESNEFAMNYQPDIQFNFANNQVYYEGNTMQFTWSTTLPTGTMVDVYLRTRAFALLSRQFKITTINAGTTRSLSWVVDNMADTAVWDYYFEFRYSCVFGYLCSSVSTPSFRIYKEATPVAWNYNTNSNSIIKNRMTLFETSCADIRSNCNENSEDFSCKVCKNPNLEAKLQLDCSNCYAKMTAGINRLNLQISWGSITQFSLNLRTNSEIALDLLAMFSMEYSKSNSTSLFSVPILGIPSIGVAGFSFEMGLYASMEFDFDFDFLGSLNASLSTKLRVSNLVEVDVATSLYSVSEISRTFENTGIEVAAQAEITAKIGFKTSLRLGFWTYPNAFKAAIKPYVGYLGSAKYPAFPALPNSQVPNNDAYFNYSAICAKPHYIEHTVTIGADYEVLSEFGDKALIRRSGNIFDYPVLSGCLWASGEEDTNAFVLIAPKNESTQEYQGVAVQFIKWDISTILNIPPESIVVDISDNDDLYTISILFLSTDNSDSEQHYQNLAAVVQNTNSEFYADDRYFSKYMTIPVPTSAPTPAPTPAPTEPNASTSTPTIPTDTSDSSDPNAIVSGVSGRHYSYFIGFVIAILLMAFN